VAIKNIMTIPHRILILGAPGSGKSTLARTIGASLQIPIVHLDALFWSPGWKVTPPELFHARISEAVAGDAWVMDGGYSRTLDLRLPRATMLIWIDLPRSIYFRRALWRSISNYGRERPDVGVGNRENSNSPSSAIGSGPTPHAAPCNSSSWATCRPTSRPSRCARRTK
jgi:adenylate kinase family enzyme